MSDDFKHEYVYISPMDEGAIQKFKMTRKQHKQIVANAIKLTPFQRAEYYLFDNKIEIERFTTTLGKTLELLLSPVGVFLYGFFEWKNAMSNLIHERKLGHFCSETIFKNGRGEDRFEAMKAIADKQRK